MSYFHITMFCIRIVYNLLLHKSTTIKINVELKDVEEKNAISIRTEILNKLIFDYFQTVCLWQVKKTLCELSLRLSGSWNPNPKSDLKKLKLIFRNKVFVGGRYDGRIEFYESLSTSRKSNFFLFIQVLSLIFLGNCCWDIFKNDSGIN